MKVRRHPAAADEPDGACPAWSAARRRAGLAAARRRGREGDLRRRPPERRDDITYQPHLLRVGDGAFLLRQGGRRWQPHGALGEPDHRQRHRLGNAVAAAAQAGGNCTEPASGAGFAELPGFAMNAANYKQVEKDFAEWLYRNERADIFTCPALKAWSKLGESEGDFRARLAHEAREARDAAIDKLRDATAKKLATLEGQPAHGAKASLPRKRPSPAPPRCRPVSRCSAASSAGCSAARPGSARSPAALRPSARRPAPTNSTRTWRTPRRRSKASQAEIETIQAELEAGIAKLTESYDPGGTAAGNRIDQADQERREGGIRRPAMAAVRRAWGKGVVTFPQSKPLDLTRDYPVM